ncbi:MAG: exodeoxyribonuclease V subunit beta [Thiomonas sp.]|nr:exodeoxyribonuclease V subunit beta [Thiomonas sp.]
MTDILDPLRLPLQGSRLIEASAGTGKTWTIAALYLRLVLGHGAAATGFGCPLSPEQILVMTFTRAATRELADRIRTRLVEAAQCFQGARQPDPADIFLQQLLDDHPPGATREGAAWRLAMAAQAMDDAAVLTIDAWCQRMLREHAFDSGQAFDEELLANESALQQQAVRDFWRQQVYALSGEDLAGVLSLWPDPDALEKEASALRRSAQAGAQLAAPKDASLQAIWQRLHAPQRAALDALKTQWAERIAAMRQWLLALVQSADCPLSKKSYANDSVRGWFDALDAWLNDPGLPQPAIDEAVWNKLTPEGLRAGCNKGKSVDAPAVFDAVGALRAALSAQTDIAPELRAYAAAQIEARLRALKATSGQFGFHDLLERLDAALAGPQGDRLRARILQQYPVALIDEFQDTSALQFAVFDRLYAITGACTAPPSSLQPGAVLLIGDPKQSIYAFRGADIASYLRARTATRGRHSMLGTNRRSTEALVQGVNRLFACRENAAGAGAFLYREEGASEADNPVPFIEVRAHGRPEQLVCACGAAHALQFCVSATLESKSAARQRFAALAAERMVDLLNDAQAGFVQHGGSFSRLRPADIAVLVRDGDEAAAIRRELKRRGVASVYLSDRDSVFASREAADLRRWLRAVAAPRDGRLARAAFATATLGLSLAELAALATDDAVFEQRLDLLGDLHAIWQRQGVLPMLRQTLHRLNLPARWLAAQGHAGPPQVSLRQSDDGERRLTNVLHLAELLQTASSTLDGEQALIRWLQAQLLGEGGEEQIVRLESEADLVRVVTIHKSKGLEYPLVFLPFSTAYKADKDPVRDQDRLREDLRLLYVALTRARHALWVGVAALKEGNAKSCVFHHSAIGYLLGGRGPHGAEQIQHVLEQVFQGMPAVQIEAAPTEAEFHRLRTDAAPPELIDAPAYRAAFERNWSIGSFSALVRDLAPRSTQQAAPPPTLQDELPDVEPELFQALPQTLQDAARHRFPRGALAGKFVHEQLAWLAENDFALEADSALQARLLQRCKRQGWDDRRAQDLREWLCEVMATRLPPLGAALPGIGPMLPEMEFWFPVEQTRAAEIDALCRRHILPGKPRPALNERVLHGMVMGFADLVFAHAGRYWVLDYKSNALGPGDAHYTQEALEAAMLDHRYDVQCALYMLALHRLLRVRLGRAYDPLLQLGGALDLFLRGVRGPQSGCVHIPPDVALLDALDALFARTGENGA